MENCLVTKLKGVVDNANLPILGQLRISIDEIDSEVLSTLNGAYNHFSFNAVNGKSFNLILDGDANMYSDNARTQLLGNGKNYEITHLESNLQVYLSNGDCKLYVDDKYSLLEFGVERVRKGANIHINLADLKYCTYLKDVRMSEEASGTGIDTIDGVDFGDSNLTDLPAGLERITAFCSKPILIEDFNIYNSLLLFNISGYNVSGDLSKLTRFSLLNSIKVMFIYNNTPTDISFLMTNPSAMLSPYNAVNWGKFKVIGDIELALENWYNLYKNVQTPKGYWYNSPSTKDGLDLKFNDTNAWQTPLLRTASNTVCCYLVVSNNILNVYGGILSEPAAGTTPTATYNGTTWTYNF